MQTSSNQLTDRPIFRYSVAGALFGLMFPIFATLFLLIHEQLPFTGSMIVDLHTSRPLLMIINTAPVFLGLFAAVAGIKQETVLEYNQSLELANQRLTREIVEKEEITQRLEEESTKERGARSNAGYGRY